MSKKSQKRKQRDGHSRNYSRPIPEVDALDPDPALFIQAYEADIVRGPKAWASAPMLEWRPEKGSLDEQNTALIRWGTHGGGDVAQDATWVDRYALCF